MPVPPLSTWNVGNIEQQNPYSSGLLPPQQSYNTGQLSDIYGQGTQLGLPYYSNHLNNVITQESRQGHGSSYYSPSTSISPPTTSKGPLTYFTGPYRPQEELDKRHNRLKMFEWKYRYTQKELLRIYLKIAKRWGTLPRSTLTGVLFHRINEQLQAHPQEIDPILFGDKSIIESRARSSGRLQIKPHRSDVVGSHPMTPEDYIDWIVNPLTYGLRRPPRDSYRDWALGSLSQQEASEVIGRLACW